MRVSLRAKTSQFEINSSLVDIGSKPGIKLTLFYLVFVPLIKTNSVTKSNFSNLLEQMYNFVVQCLVSVLWALLVCDIKVIYSLRAHFEKKTSFKPKKWKFLRLYSQAKVIQKVANIIFTIFY